ncbi:hypothetical protein CVT26_006441 [Gymnopilus dilepis]|uniref:Uncharacterized protein n=1 Tax=Gymnopilus dilepis TaxID=231916 RepID=A0A409Y1S7_9AGAR|nr:hypothetical protein CVT26_006441 [Gymnopilus dilepis]
MESPTVMTSNVLGPLFVGYVFGLILLGIMFMQILLYFTQHKKDNIWMRIFVATLFVLNILNTTFNLTYLYRTMIVFFGNVDHLLSVSWLLDTEPILTAVILFMIQCFLAWRTYQLAGTWIYMVLVMVASVVSFVGGILNSAHKAHVTNVNEFESNKTTVLLWLIPGVFSIAIVFSIHMWYLVCTKMLSSTRVLFGTHKTGLSILIVAFIDLVVYLGSEGTGWHLIFNNPLSKVYSVTFICMLNSRSGWSFRGLTAETPQILQPGRTYDVKLGPNAQWAAPRVDITVHVD